jgi:amino acid adenylation domain-containing protein
MMLDSTPNAAPPEALLLGRGPVRELASPSVLALFRAQAARSPDALAVRHGQQTLSYRQLREAVDRLAARLTRAGVTPGELVGLCVVRSLDVVVAMLAILQTGAAYLPLDQDTPKLRVEHIVRQAALRRALVQRAVAPLFADTGTQLVMLDAPADGAAQAPVQAKKSAPGFDDLAYVIFTSGSSGAPKGVEVRHVSLANHAQNMVDLYQLGPGDRMLCSASIGFDVAAEQIYPALLAGAEVVIRPASLFSSLESFNRYLHEASITALVLPTAFFHEWTHELGARRLVLSPSVRVVGVGTEQVAATALSTFLACGARPLRFIHGYGPTEATITCTAYLHDGRSFDSSDVVPIGRPLANIEAHVLDAACSPVHDGEVGELYIGGVALARGYLGRADLTRDRFIEHSFPGEGRTGARLYRTGDLVRRSGNGELYFLGRADTQLKVRGHRVEPEEIELLLKQQPGVLDAAVVQRGLLVAYLACDQPLDMAALRATCRQRLPAYMVPGSFVPLRHLPMTFNQKVDRAALRALVHEEARPELASSDGELLVARAFAEVLGTPSVGRDDDFFERGGDSLRALRVLQLLRQSHTAELALADFFEAPTVRALGLRVTRGGSVDRASVLCLKSGVGTPLFLVAGIQIYQALATALHASNPVYALLLPSESWELSGADVALPTTDELAAQYVRLMHEHTPQGPYLLGGLSFGGAIAYAMAQQLRAAGEPVDLLALFDTVLPRATRRLTWPWLRTQLQTLRSPGQLRGRLTVLGQRGVQRAKRLVQARLQPAVRSERESASAEALRELDRRRERAYAERLRDFDRTIAAYPGPVVLYRAMDNSEGSHLPDHGFAAFTPDLRVCDVPGDHLGILREPAVAALAAHLAEQIRPA